MAATINAHYFGILLLVPVCAAEGWRTLERRRIDWAMYAAIFVGMAGFLATRPFMKAAAEFKKNYYNGGAVGLHDITRAYRSIFVDYTQMRDGAAACVDGGAGGVCGGAGVGMLAGDAARGLISAAEWVLLLTLAALPFCGYLLARFVTHSIEVRYVLGAVVAISAMVAIAMSPLAAARCGV